MYKIINLFSWVTTLVESFTFYGGGGKGGGSESSSVSMPIDFFGRDIRAPYEQLLGQLLGVYPMQSSGKNGSFSGGSGTSSSQSGGYVDFYTGKTYYEPPTQATIDSYNQAKQASKALTGTDIIYNSPDYNAMAAFFTKKNRTPTNFTGGSSILDFIKAQPGYQFGMDQGQQALERRFSSTGIGQSGAENIALAGYGQAYAGDYYQKMINNLMAASGSGMAGNMTTSESSSQGPSGLGGALGTIAGAAFSGNPFGNAFRVAGINPTSDRNLKTNIKHINTINGIKIYSFNYIWSYIKSIGVMAQDLLKMPQYKDAVHMTSIGYAVDYSKLPI
mgnify:CR=1 FL=1